VVNGSLRSKPGSQVVAPEVSVLGSGFPELSDWGVPELVGLLGIVSRRMVDMSATRREDAKCFCLVR